MFLSVFSFFLLLLSFLLPPCVSARTLPPSYTADQPVSATAEQNYKYTWHEFERFQDASRGSHIAGISEFKKYFHRFGYLAMHETNFTDAFDTRLEHAITRYQSNLGLFPTGKLDLDTLSRIMLPRCGVPDTTKKKSHVGPKNTSDFTRHYEYFTGRPRWARGVPVSLRYAFSPDNFIKSLSLSDVRGAFGRAFAHWESVIPVRFSETSDYVSADVKIGFYRGDHGDGDPFDGVLGVLAHAFSPPSGKFHLDAAETWTVDFQSEKSRVAVDLESVATHEIGHLLGLTHTSVREAIMYPSMKPRERKVDLTLDDIKGIQALYGSNPNFKFEALPESDTSLNHAIDLGVRSTSKWTLRTLLLILWLCI